MSNEVAKDYNKKDEEREEREEEGEVIEYNEAEDEDDQEKDRQVKRVHFEQTEEEKQEREKRLRQIKTMLEPCQINVTPQAKRVSPVLIDVIDLSDSDSDFQEDLVPPNSVMMEVKEEEEDENDDRKENIDDKRNDKNVYDGEMLSKIYAAHPKAARLIKEYEENPFQKSINQQLRKNNAQQYAFARRLQEQRENQQVQPPFLNEQRRTQRRKINKPYEEVNYPITFQVPMTMGYPRAQGYLPDVNCFNNEEQCKVNDNNYFSVPINMANGNNRIPHHSSTSTGYYVQEPQEQVLESNSNNPIYCSNNFSNSQFIQSSIAPPQFVPGNNFCHQSETNRPKFKIGDDRFFHPYPPNPMHLGMNNSFQTPVNNNTQINHNISHPYLFNHQLPVRNNRIDHNMGHPNLINYQTPDVRNNAVEPNMRYPYYINHPQTEIRKTFEADVPHQQHHFINNSPFNNFKQFSSNQPNNYDYYRPDPGHGRNNFQGFLPSQFVGHQSNQIPNNVFLENNNQFFIQNHQQPTISESLHPPHHSGREVGRSFVTNFQPTHQGNTQQYFNPMQNSTWQNFVDIPNLNMQNMSGMNSNVPRGMQNTTRDEPAQNIYFQHSQQNSCSNRPVRNNTVTRDEQNVCKQPYPVQSSKRSYYPYLAENRKTENNFSQQPVQNLRRDMPVRSETDTRNDLKGHNYSQQLNQVLHSNGRLETSTTVPRNPPAQENYSNQHLNQSLHALGNMIYENKKYHTYINDLKSKSVPQARQNEIPILLSAVDHNVQNNRELIHPKSRKNAQVETAVFRDFTDTNLKNSTSNTTTNTNEVCSNLRKLRSLRTIKVQSGAGCLLEASSTNLQLFEKNTNVKKAIPINNMLRTSTENVTKPQETSSDVFDVCISLQKSENNMNTNTEIQSDMHQESSGFSSMRDSPAENNGDTYPMHAIPIKASNRNSLKRNASIKKKKA